MELQEFFVGDVVELKKHPGVQCIVSDAEFWQGFRYATTESAWHFASEFILVERANERTLTALQAALDETVDQ